MSLLADRLVATHDALTGAAFPHAFGGAIALAYCTLEPRGTRDLDINVFAGVERAGELFRSLPDGVTVTDDELAAVRRDGQVRLWWDDTPIDLFLDTDAFHDEVAAGVQWVPFAGRQIPVLGCAALAVFKALFDRTKDWADIEAMCDAGAVDPARVAQTVGGLAGGDHPAVARLRSLAPG